MLDPHHLKLPRTRIHGARLGVSFLGDQSAQLPEAADAATQQMQQEELKKHYTVCATAPPAQCDQRRSSCFPYI